MRIHFVPGVVIKNSDKLTGQWEVLMHRVCKIESFPSSYLWFFNFYYFMWDSLSFSPLPIFYFLSHWLRVDLLYSVRRILLRVDSNLDVLCVNIISWISNFLESEACINTQIFEFSVIWGEVFNLLNAIFELLYVCWNVLVLWRSRWVLILRQTKRIMLSGIRKE